MPPPERTSAVLVLPLTTFYNKGERRMGFASSNFSDKSFDAAAYGPKVASILALHGD